jgi:prevent-host-death family protein
VKQIAQRDLRNDVSDILRQVESGETFVVTVGGRPVAELVAYDRRRWVPKVVLEQLFTSPAPVGMLEDMAEMDFEMTDPWAE